MSFSNNSLRDLVSFDGLASFDARIARAQEMQGVKPAGFEWITNCAAFEEDETVKDLDPYYQYRVGEPRGTDAYSSTQLMGMGMVGIYRKKK